MIWQYDWFLILSVQRIQPLDRFSGNENLFRDLADHLLSFEYSGYE